MNLKHNIIAGYASQTYVTLIGIVMLPLYIKYIGAEAYGLVGFFAMLQIWFNLLDMGLTPTIVRETARFRGGAIDKLSYRRLLKALEGIFLAIAVAGGCVLFLSADYISRNWLQTTQLPIAEVHTALQLMAAIIAMRWMCGLYRGVISGLERLVWLGGYNSIIATIRFIGVLLVLEFVGVTPTIFFSFQFCVAVLELAGLILYGYRLLPVMPDGAKVAWSWKPLKPVLKFSMTIAFASFVWVMFTQTDKLVLSKLLPLAEYGYFTLAVLVAGGVTMINGPISGAIMPRMAKLDAEGNHADLISVYRRATQLVAVIASAVCVTLAFCADTLLWAWTGDKVLAGQAAPILMLYAIGNGILAVSAFPFYLQYAKGDLRLHFYGNAMFVGLLIPLIIWAASQYGGIGAGCVWLIMNAVFFVTWLPFIHHKFAPGLNLKWYFQDVLIIFAAVVIAGFGLNEVFPHADNRALQIGIITTFGFLLLLVGACFSSLVREKAIKKFGCLK